MMVWCQSSDDAELVCRPVFSFSDFNNFSKAKHATVSTTIQTLFAALVLRRARIDERDRVRIRFEGH
jgi:hypothetical protein